MKLHQPIIRVFNEPQDYYSTWQAMIDFHNTRDKKSADEVWLMQHNPVYTQGRAGKPEHVLNPKNIPIIETDRGGQVTYHGPGQLMIYMMLDIDRLSLNTRTLVCAQENLVLQTLKYFGIQGHRIDNAPGIYVNNEKIASIGLRVSRGACYHGMALNIDMDLTPFLGINPCGYSQLKMTQMYDHNNAVTLKLVCDHIQTQLT